MNIKENPLKRKNFHLTPKQVEDIQALSAKMEMSAAAIIRLSIDAFIEAEKKKQEAPYI